MTIPNEQPQTDDQKSILQQQKELAELQKAVAEARKADAEAQKAAIEATFSKGETKPVAGAITTDADKFGYIAELIAYQTMKDSAKKVGKAINEWKPTSDSSGKARILIVPERSFAPDDLPMLQIEKQFALFGDLLADQIGKNTTLLGGKEVSPPESSTIEMLEVFEPVTALTAVSTALAAAPAIVSSVADLVGYFQVDYTVKGQTIQLGSDALSAVVAGEIKKHQIYFLNFSLLSDSEVVNRFEELVGQSRKLEKAKEMLKIQAVQQATADIQAMNEKSATQKDALEKLDKDKQSDQVKKLEEAIQNSKEALKLSQDQLDDVNRAVAESENLLKTFGDFVAAITSGPDEKTSPLFVKAVIRQHIRKQGITHLLHLSILSSGGEAITKKRLFRSGDAAFIGGSVIAFVMVSSEGQVMMADTKIALAQFDLNLSAPNAASVCKIPLGE